MDGSIWEFTEDEMREMPDCRPMTNRDARVVGRSMMQWYIDGRYYIRFYTAAEIQDHPDVYPEWLAGWVTGAEKVTEAQKAERDRILAARESGPILRGF